MDNEKKKALDALRQGKRSGRDKVKNEVAKSMDGDTKRERLVAANSSDLVPTLALTESERSLYDTIALHMEKTGMLATVDTIPLTMLAQSMFLYGQAKSRIDSVDSAITYIGTNGSPALTGEYMVMKTERKATMDLLKDLGLDPKARIKLFAELAGLASKQEDDQRDDLFD